jgi:hypothetical protein
LAAADVVAVEEHRYWAARSTSSAGPFSELLTKALDPYFDAGIRLHLFSSRTAGHLPCDHPAAIERLPGRRVLVTACAPVS